MATTRAFGCRSPKSQGIGRWDGAFVYCRSGLKGMSAYFENNMDYIGGCPINQAIKEYNKCLIEGWLPMTEQDLSKTAGITIDQYTNISAPQDNESELDVPVKCLADLIPKEQSTQTVQKTKECFQNFRDKNPTIMKNILDIMEQNTEIQKLKDKHQRDEITIGQLLNISTKLVESLTEDQLAAMSGFGKQLFTNKSPNEIQTPNGNCVDFGQDFIKTLGMCANVVMQDNTDNN